jgi:cellulase/cellobiase CelA1
MHMLVFDYCRLFQFIFHVRSLLDKVRTDNIIPTTNMCIWLLLIFYKMAHLICARGGQTILYEDGLQYSSASRCKAFMTRIHLTAGFCYWVTNMCTGLIS